MNYFEDSEKSFIEELDFKSRKNSDSAKSLGSLLDFKGEVFIEQDGLLEEENEIRINLNEEPKYYKDNLLLEQQQKKIIIERKNKKKITRNILSLVFEYLTIDEIQTSIIPMKIYNKVFISSIKTYFNHLNYALVHYFYIDVNKISSDNIYLESQLKSVEFIFKTKNSKYIPNTSFIRFYKWNKNSNLENTINNISVILNELSKFSPPEILEVKQEEIIPEVIEKILISYNIMKLSLIDIRNIRDCAIFDIIMKGVSINKTLQVINLSNNCLNEENTNSFFKAIEDSCTINTLYLNYNNFKPSQIEKIAKLLESGNIKVLHLNNCNLSTIEIEVLCKYLKKSSLRELHLEGNCYLDEGTNLLIEFSPKTLEVLNVKNSFNKGLYFSKSKLRIVV